MESIEIWKEHPKINGYEFSNLGRFRNIKTKKILKESIYRNDVVTFLPFHNETKRKRVRIARIVAEIYIPNTNPNINNIIIHKDGNGLNNNINNLIWSTTKETVKIAIEKGKRKTSNWEVLTNDEIIAIREEFNNSDITLREIAVKYNTTSDNISSIVRYRSRANVQPHRKFDYKINSVDLQEYSEFLNKKEKRAKFLVKKRIHHIPNDILPIILDEYVNTTLTVNELAQKFKIKPKAIKFNIAHNTLPKVNIFEDEIFKNISNTIKISNLGRVIVNDKLTNQSRFTYKNKKIGLRMLVGILFVDNPNNYPTLKSIDNNIHNINYKNLEWTLPNKPIFFLDDGELKSLCLWEGKMVPLETVKDKIIQEYLERTENINIPEKYLIGKKTAYNLIKPHIKKDTIKHCVICGEINQRYFYKHVHSKCKLCANDTHTKNDPNHKPKKLKTAIWINKNKYTVHSKLIGAKSRARNKGLAYDLDEKFIHDLFKKQNGRCAYSNLKIKLDMNGDGEFFSIDRIDSLKGYTKDNVVLTTSIINRMKLDYTVDEFFHIIKQIYESKELKQKNFPEKNF
jgi:predicted DNA-binding protein YlxM (UPF0122 family)